MIDATADLARSITAAGSKHTYYLARLTVDKELLNDFYRAYAYFRWVDDVIDESLQSDDERFAFIRRQRQLIDLLYSNQRPASLTPEEAIVVDLICHDKEEGSGLQSFIRNMLAVIEFDAYRKGRLISQHELTWYSNCLATAVTDGLQYFIGHRYPYPASGQPIHVRYGCTYYAYASRHSAGYGQRIHQHTW